MGSGQQRCNYEVSRAKPLENDPREARGEVLFASEPNNATSLSMIQGIRGLPLPRM